MTILGFLKRPVSNRWRCAPAQTRKHGSRPELPSQAVAEKRRLADTNGTLRRMRQTVEDNRLL